ncbi:MAG TPA: DUF2784 domain-containing protein [Pirellulaceae bacterium]|nr:DUF2784 domain-containing protein [Pirellulaceae bacterium]
MTLLYRLLADLTVIIHAAYVTVVVGGQLLILIGAWRKWRWTRRVGFRVAHLTMIGIVVAESWAGVTCPLTVWEQRLRALAGQASYQGDFIGACVHDLLFFDLPPWAFTLIYSAFGALVALSWWWAPPTRRVRRGDSPDGSPTTTPSPPPTATPNESEPPN